MTFKNIFQAFVLSLGLVLVGCGKESPQSQTANNPPPAQAVQVKIDPAEKYVEGMEYTYYPSDNNQSCKPSEKNTCLTLDQYKEICSVAKGVTQFAIKMRGTLASNKEKVLLEGGSYDNIEVLWAKSGGGKDQCYAVITVSGIVDGNSAREEIQGVAMTFIKSAAGKVLVSYFSLL
jgi:hypothetical protein